MTHGVKSLAWRRGAAVLMALWLALLSGLAATAQDAASAPSEVLPKVIDMRILNNAERARLIVDLGAVTQFAVASLAAPNRIVVDLRAAGIEQPVDDTSAGDGLIGSYALSVAEEGRVRATLTLAVPAQVQQAYLAEPVDGQPARLIIDLIPDGEEHFAANVADDLKAAIARTAGDGGAETAPAAAPTDDVAAPADAQETATEPEPTPATDGPPKARPLIVIDPGHGGADGGAEAANGAKEKDIALKFARELKRLLVAQNRYDVAMTRDDDSFVRLEDRVTLARANKADLFVSIHADTFQDPTISGASIYVRDERATDVLDKVLADSENRADLVAGFAPPDADVRVTSILVELMRRETRRQSYIAANTMLQSLEPGTRLRPYPLRKADFFVLQAPEVPSVLIELGFISNDADVANLTTGGWRDKTAEAIAKGIASYFDGMAQN